MARYTPKALPSETDSFSRSPRRTISRRSVRFVAEGHSTSCSQHASSRSAIIESLSPPTEGMGRAHHKEYRLQIFRFGRQAMAQGLEEVGFALNRYLPDECPVTAFSGSLWNGQGGIGGNRSELVFKTVA